MMRLTALLCPVMLLAACGGMQDDGVIDVAIIGEPDALFEQGLRLGYAGQHLRAAASQGLVRLDAGGQVVPAIAERWIVTDDGKSYIFRIREFDLPDGTRLTAQAVRDSLRRTMERLEGTSLGLDLAKVRDIRAMTGRVIEIRLESPMPDLLQLLAQPEMGLRIGEAATGPMSVAREDDTATLEALPPEQRGLPEQPDWEEGVRLVRVTAAPARAAVDGFTAGAYDLVLGGTLVNLPLVDTGPLSRGTVRLDSAIGLFGLDVVRAERFLADPANREALSMALDRAALIQPFNIGGWVATTRIVPPGLSDERDEAGERWAGLDLAERRAEASRRVAAWEAANGEEAALRVGLPQGPGSEVLFEGLAAQYAQIGVALRRVAMGQQADLELRDRVARYGGARWFLNQFNCTVSDAICSQDVDFLVQLAAEARNPGEAASYLAEAEDALAAFNPFIPFGAPIRWSLVRADIEGFGENPWNLHPLFPLSGAPI